MTYLRNWLCGFLFRRRTQGRVQAELSALREERWAQRKRMKSISDELDECKKQLSRIERSQEKIIEVLKTENKKQRHVIDILQTELRLAEVTVETVTKANRTFHDAYEATSAGFAAKTTLLSTNPSIEGD